VNYGMRVLVSGSLVVALLMSAGVSAAQVKESKSEQGYGYEFDDDPLNAGGFLPGDAIIRVRPGAAKGTLIRPRVNYVPEMLKSVEHL
jgi:hypothetical protein